LFKKRICFLILLLCSKWILAQQRADSLLYVFRDDVDITIDQPLFFNKSASTVIIIYALPNGNTTAQTMGKKMQPGDDWHFDIQHIKAQTEFIRSQWKEKNIVVVYLENEFKSWPSWKAKHIDYKERVVQIINTIFQVVPAKNAELYLNGHSGGGRFIFSYIDAYDEIPAMVKRISFIDSNYGYDSSYYSKLTYWLKTSSSHHLNVFAYNDSVALYNDKPVVSPTGGTWWRSHRMLQDLSTDFKFEKIRDDSLIIYKSADLRIQFFLKTNPDRKIYHTQQVELNGFIHSIFCGTRYDSKNYMYYSRRAYEQLIE